MDPTPEQNSDESTTQKAVSHGLAHALVFIVGLLLLGVVALLYCLLYPTLKHAETMGAGVKTESVQR